MFNTLRIHSDRFFFSKFENSVQKAVFDIKHSGSIDSFDSVHLFARFSPVKGLRVTFMHFDLLDLLIIQKKTFPYPHGALHACRTYTCSVVSDSDGFMGVCCWPACYNAWVGKHIQSALCRTSHADLQFAAPRVCECVCLRERERARAHKIPNRVLPMWSVRFCSGV